MNKLVTVLGVAAVATLAGCKDPNYKPMSESQDEVKVVEPTPAPAPSSDFTPVAPKCKCAPGTKHTSPCTCGAPDCQCIVEVKPLPPPPVSEPAYTTYIVQNGDYLAKISKKFNVTIDSIKKLNGLKGDVIRVGQKLKLPGKVDVGVQSAPVAPVKAAAAKPAAVAVDYKGATKEYVVKGGDTLGAIAYSNGITIRQLKKLNGLTSDVVRVGQKLKVPAAGKAAVAEKKPEAKANAAKKAEAPKVAAPVEKPVLPPPPAATTEPAPVVDAPAAPAVTEPTAAAPTTAPAAAAPAAEPATSTYVVQESDDMTGVTIRFGVSAAAIRELNNLPEDAQLTPGQIIKLPPDAQQ